MLRRETDGKNLNRSATPKAGPKQEQVMLRREKDGKDLNRSATPKARPKQEQVMLRRKTGIKKFNAIRIRGEPNPPIRIPDFFTSRSRPEDSTDVRRDPDDRPKPAFPLLPPSAFSLFAGVPIFAATCPMPPLPPAGGIAAAPMADAPRRAGLRRQEMQGHDHHRAERRPRRASVRRSAFRVRGRIVRNPKTSAPPPYTMQKRLDTKRGGLASRRPPLSIRIPIKLFQFSDS